MNLEVENIGGLIDISLEDDFLIDKRFDNSSVDLRLSVAFETQMQLLCDLKPMARVGKNERIQYLADNKELETYQIEREYGDIARNSLAWDNAFLTSPGFLELEELCLVNRGFKDPQRQSVCGDLQSTRSKVCVERNSGHKSRVSATCRQSTRSLTRLKLASPTKMMAMQDSQHQLMTTRRSEAFPGATSKSQGTTKRKEYLKSTRFSIAHNKKTPLQGVSRNGENRTPERLRSVVSSLPFLPSTVTNTSIELSPYRSKDNSAQTVNLTKSQEIKGECFSGSHSPASVCSRNTDVGEPSPQGTQASCTSSSGGRPNNQKLRQLCIKQVNSGRELQRQNATRRTKSPLSAISQGLMEIGMKRVRELRTCKIHPAPPPMAHTMFNPHTHLRLTTHQSNTHSGSNWSGKSEVSTANESSLLSPVEAHTHRLNDVDPKRTRPILQESKAQTHDEDGIKPCNYHIVLKRRDTLGKEKENVFLSEDNVIEMEPKDGSPLPLRLDKNGSSIPGKSSGSSRKRSIAAQSTTTRKAFSTRISPLQKSSIF